MNCVWYSWFDCDCFHDCSSNLVSGFRFQVSSVLFSGFIRRELETLNLKLLWLSSPTWPCRFEVPGAPALTEHVPARRDRSSQHRRLSSPSDLPVGSPELHERNYFRQFANRVRAELCVH